MGQNHSVKLNSLKVENNAAFGGSLMHLGADTVNATRQVDAALIFMKGNIATVGAPGAAAADAAARSPCVI